MESIRIVLADHALMREGTRSILEQEPHFKVVGEAGDGEQALEMIKEMQPDVALIDIRMPRLSGIDVVRKLKSCCPNIRTLVLTAYDDDDYITAMMEAGASGYLLKTAEPKELIQSVRAVYSGEAVLHPTIAAKLARMWAHGTVIPEHIPTNELSPRELEVLELAAKGLRNKAIADKLGISVRTVEGHLNFIFAKLGVSSRTEAVLLAISRGVVSKEKETKE